MKKIDCVGSCVGMRGQRVKNIVMELNDEKIDIVRWNADIEIFMKNSLAPAELEKITLNKDRKIAEILVKDDQLSLAIGKKGQNIRLSSKLTGYLLNVKSLLQRVALKDLDGVGAKTEKILKENGVETVKDLLKYSADDLKKMEGIGAKTADKIVEAAHQALLTTESKSKEHDITAGLADMAAQSSGSSQASAARKRRYHG